MIDAVLFAYLAADLAALTYADVADALPLPPTVPAFACETVRPPARRSS